MEIYERLRELRKNHLKMSMETFGNRLGVSRDTINNIELNRLARPEKKISLYKLVCKEVNVSENWLFNGVEPMFINHDTSTMEKLRQEFDLDDFSYNLVHEYLKLDANTRQTVRDFFYNVINKDTINVENEKSEIELQYDAAHKTSEELEALYLTQTAVKKNGTDEK